MLKDNPIQDKEIYTDNEQTSSEKSKIKNFSQNWSSAFRKKLLKQIKQAENSPTQRIENTQEYITMIKNSR